MCLSNDPLNCKLFTKEYESVIVCQAGRENDKNILTTAFPGAKVESMLCVELKKGEPV